MTFDPRVFMGLTVVAFGTVAVVSGMITLRILNRVAASSSRPKGDHPWTSQHS